MPASPACPCWAWPSPSGVPSTSQGSLFKDTLLKTKNSIDVVLQRNCFQRNNLFQNHKLLVSMFNLCSRLYCTHICRCKYIYIYIHMHTIFGLKRRKPQGPSFSPSLNRWPCGLEVFHPGYQKEKLYWCRTPYRRGAVRELNMAMDL